MIVDTLRVEQAEYNENFKTTRYFEHMSKGFLSKTMTQIQRQLVFDLSKTMSLASVYRLRPVSAGTTILWCTVGAMQTRQILHRMRGNRDSPGERLSSMSFADPDDDAAIQMNCQITTNTTEL